MASEDARKLFVAGLPDSITEEALREIFEATGGKVTDVSLPRDRATGRVRGFGFVTFSVAEEAAAARDSLDGSLQAGRPISVRPFSSEPPRRDAVGPAREGGGGGFASGGGGGFSGGAGSPGGAGQEDRTLYVGNLPYDVTQQEVTQLFTDNSVAPPVRIHLPVGPDGRLRGFGFVTCASAEAANEALLVVRNLDLRGRRLMVNIAHPRGERPATTGVRPAQGGWQGSAGGEQRFPAEPAPGGDSSVRPVDPHRARTFGPSAPPGGGGGGDWDDKKKKKKAAGAGRKGGASDAGGRRERGGGGRQWGDPDDE